MKTHAMVRGLRVTLTKTELQALLNLARYGAEQLAAARSHYILPKRQEAVTDDVIHGLELGLASVRWKQAEARERRERPKREEARRRAREHHTQVDGHTVFAMLGDFADISDDPDRRQWADVYNPSIELREQGELRRNVWRIYITKGTASAGDLIVLPGDCTQTADREEIEPLARQIIAKHRE